MLVFEIKGLCVIDVELTLGNNLLRSVSVRVHFEQIGICELMCCAQSFQITLWQDGTFLYKDAKVIEAYC